MEKQLPVSFRERTEPLLQGRWSDFALALDQPAPVSLRFNQRKVAPSEQAAALPHLADPVPWCSNAYYLPKRPVFTLDPLLHAGGYYVQEAASMFLEQCVKEASRHRELRTVLDLCAAPGGKSTHLASLLTLDSLLVSNDVIRTRAAILRENTIKWGFPNTVVTNNDPKDFGRLSSFFDLIWVDAPCSGEGMFRKDLTAIREWSPGTVEHCAARQRRILCDCWDSLQAGGFLAYSTCTYNKDENEEVVKWFMATTGAESIPVGVLDDWGASPSLDPAVHAVRFFPHQARGEGFFACLLQKPSDDLGASRRRSRFVVKTFPDLLPWLQQGQEWHFEQQATTVYAHPARFAADIAELRQRLSVLLSGVKVADIKGKDKIPSIDLALCTALETQNVATWEVDRDTALRYLHRDSLTNTPFTLPRGHVLVCHQRIPLGWVKHLGNRSNNLYPSEWRIRMELGNG